MNLANIYNSQKVWPEIAKLKLSPKTAYQLLRYMQAIADEANAIEQYRIQLIRSLANVAENENASLEPGTDEYVSFTKQFSEFLMEESNLKPLPVSMDAFMLELESFPGYDNEISVQQLALIQPFFEDEDAIQVEETRAANVGQAP